VPEAGGAEGGKQCRSTFIRPHLAVDDEGYVCDRKLAFDNRGSQCCGKRTPATQHTCKQCDKDSGCCLEYEHCVSCCLHSSNQANLKAGDVWEQCIDRCRTSAKTIEGVWNGYRTDLKHCYGAGDPPDYNHANLDVSEEDITTVKAESANQDCNDACRAKGKECSPAGFFHINKCAALKDHFPCKECEESLGAEQPAYELEGNKRCLYSKSTRVITCGARHEATKRLCACQ